MVIGTQHTGVIEVLLLLYYYYYYHYYCNHNLLITLSMILKSYYNYTVLLALVSFCTS